MKKDSFFKFLFWMLTILIFGLVIVGISIGTWAISQDPYAPKIIIAVWWLMMVFFGAIITAISVFVYKDAAKRGLDRWMWMTIAVYVPNFIGIVLYLIYRNNNDTKCGKCGKGVKKDFEVCPYCGNMLKAHCSNCGKNVESNWQVCPHCTSQLR